MGGIKSTRGKSVVKLSHLSMDHFACDREDKRAEDNVVPFRAAKDRLSLEPARSASCQVFPCKARAERSSLVHVRGMSGTHRSA